MIEILGLDPIGEVGDGTDLSAVLSDALRAKHIELRGGDVHCG